MLSFFFKEVVDFGVLLPYQLFENADLSFELVGARTDATEELMTALKFKDFTESSRFRENNYDREVSSALPSTSVA